MKRTTVLLADDDGSVRKGFRRLLKVEPDLEVVGEAENGREAVDLVKKLHPAVVLMDIAMPLVNGLQATCQILETVPETKVLILSGQSDDAYVEAATRSGARGYLLKQIDAENVCPAIREVVKGNTFFSPSIPSRLHKGNGKE